MDSDNKNDAGEVTQLLQRWANGDGKALDALWPMVYDDVRKLARRQLASERGDHTLQGTALVNEAFLKLTGQRVTQWQNREQFLALASQIMRRVLVDYARRRKAIRRGRHNERISLDDTQAAIEIDNAQALASFEDEKVDVLAIDEALQRLEKFDAAQSRIVELRYFGGLTIEETAAVAEVSTATVKREWALARAWLRRELSVQADEQKNAE
jgi:RNA polymerase sigma factor (TIGR02999 family)